MYPFSRSLSILIYHRVVPERDMLVPDQVCATEFDWQLGVLSRWFKVFPLSEAIERLREGTLPRRAAAVTFDDGYADNESVALPLLRRHGVPATFFIATSFLDGGRMFNDSLIETVRAAHGNTLDGRCIGLESLPIATVFQRRQAIDTLLRTLKYLPQDERENMVTALAVATGVQLPRDLMMTASQVRRLGEFGMELGAHTATHPILANLSTEAATADIVHGRDRLQKITGLPVKLFAYPNGKPGVDYLKEHCEIVRRLGFDAALTTAWGTCNADSDFYQLPRFTPWDKTPARFLARLMGNTFRVNVARV